MGNDLSHLLNVEAEIERLNTQSFYPKIDEIRGIVDKNYFDIFCLSKTRLPEYIKNDEIHIPEYNIFRRDGATNVGGGVRIYVKQNIYANLRTDLIFEHRGYMG